MPTIPGVSDFTGLSVNGALIDAINAPSTLRPRHPLAKILYVCSIGGNGDSTGYGTGVTPQEPYATLAAAITAIAGRTTYGDIIYVLPGHVETISSADYFSGGGAAANFSVIGLGSGTNRPSFTWTTATSTWLLDTDGVEVKNLRLFLAGAHVTGAALTVAAPITVSGNNVALIGNQIFWGFEVDRIVGDGIIWTGDGGIMYGNNCLALVAAVPTNTFLTLTGADDFYLGYNSIEGPTDATTRGVVDVETTECLRMVVERNYISNVLASSTIAFSPLTSSTGYSANNKYFVNSGILPITAGLLSWYDDKVVNGAGEAGALVGTASA